MAVIKDAGVTSKDAFQTPIPSAAILTVRTSSKIFSPSLSITGPRIVTSSSAGLSSILISSPESVEKSIEVVGAATKNGML